MMTGGWTNGEIFLPFSQTLLTTWDDSLMVGADTPVDRRTIRGRRRAAAKEKGTDTVCRMVREAKKTGIPFDFVQQYSNYKQSRCEPAKTYCRRRFLITNG